MPSAMIAIVRTTLVSSCSSGLTGRLPSWVSWASDARRVCDPVADTWAMASPLVT